MFVDKSTTLEFRQSRHRSKYEWKMEELKRSTWKSRHVEIYNSTKGEQSEHKISYLGSNELKEKISKGKKSDLKSAENGVDIDHQCLFPPVPPAKSDGAWHHHSTVASGSPSCPIPKSQIFVLRISVILLRSALAIAPVRLWSPALAVEAMEPQAKIPKLDDNNGHISNGKAVLASKALRIKKLSENAVVPSRGSALAAGYDLSSAYDAVVPARGKALVKTDLSIAIPEGTYGRVAPRSGLAWKHSIDCGAGVIDADYRGPLGVILFNHADSDFEIKAGDRIAQLILEVIVTPDIVEVDDLDATVRGEGGFGSTGVALVVESPLDEACC